MRVGGAERVTLAEARAIIDEYVRALAKGDFGDAVKAAGACRNELMRRHHGRQVASLATLTAHIRQGAGMKQLAYAKARWSSDDEEVLRRYARGFVAGRYPSARQAAALCQREIEQRESTDPRRGVLRRTRYGYYAKLLELARDMNLPYIHRAWTPAERRVLNQYARRLFAGTYRYTRDAAAECAVELVKVGRHVRTPNSRPRPPRSTQAVYHELTVIAAKSRLPRYKAHWTRPELDILERYARSTAQGKYRHWNEAAAAAMKELRELYVGKGTGIRPARLAGHRASDAEQQIRVLARGLNLGGPRMRYWTRPEERILRKWVKVYHEGHRPGKRGPIRALSEGLRDELRSAGFTRVLSACSYRLIEERRKVYRVAYPSPRRWMPTEDKVADSWARWYDRHRRTHRLEPYKAATEGLQEDLAKIGSDRSLCACGLRLLKRHRLLHGLA